MKKTKKIVVAILGVILCVMLMCTPSFSWFTRESQTGGYFKWSNNGSNTALNYNSSNGENISMKTYSSLDGNTYGDAEVTSFSENDGVSAGECKYYRTDILNSGTTAQSVSLYLSNLKTSNTGDFYLGLNGPLKTYKNYSNSDSGENKVKSDINKKNIYVGFVTSQTPEITDFKVHYWTRTYLNSDKTKWNDSDSGDATVGSTKYGSNKSYTISKDNASYNNYNANYNMYVATIPYGANSVILRNGDNYYDMGDNTEVDKYNTILWFHYDSAYHTNKAISDTSAGINTFYSEAAVQVGKTLDIHADCQGKSIQYESSNENVVTVDQNGVITGVSAGTAVVKVKSYGIYTDCIEAECVVTVGAQSNETPIITNLNIPAKSGDKESVVSVYWYIKNDTESDILTYTIEDLFLSL